MRAALALALLALTLGVASGRAEAQSLGLGRRLDRPLPRAPEPEGGPDAEDGPSEEGAEPEEREEEGFPGPQIALHYEHFKLSDGYGGGDAHTGGLSVFVQWPVHELRTGLLVEMGSRGTSLAGDDLVIRGGVEIGFQLPALIDPLVPHISAVAAFGGVVGQRFETTVAHAFGGGGIELGAALRLFRSLHLDVTFGYLRLEMDGAGFDVFLLRLGVGL